MEDDKKTPPVPVEERAAKPPKVWTFTGQGHGPTIRFDGDPAIYRADDLTQDQIKRYIEETPGQTLFALK